MTLGGPEHRDDMKGEDNTLKGTRLLLQQRSLGLRSHLQRESECCRVIRNKPPSTTFDSPIRRSLHRQQRASATSVPTPCIHARADLREKDHGAANRHDGCSSPSKSY